AHEDLGGIDSPGQLDEVLHTRSPIGDRVDRNQPRRLRVVLRSAAKDPRPGAGLLPGRGSFAALRRTTRALSNFRVSPLDRKAIVPPFVNFLTRRSLG